MGRAERILVFAVFGVIALILGITAFLPEAPTKDQKSAAKGSGEPGKSQGSPQAPTGGNPTALTPVERLLQADKEPPAGVSSTPAAEERKDGSGPVDAGARPAEGGAVTTAPIRFGTRHPGNPNYLVVKVRGGETFGQIVERECGSLQHYMEQAIALNEAVEPNNIRTGQELILPFVPEDQLPRRAAKSPAVVQTSGLQANGPSSGAAGGNTGAEDPAASSTFPRGDLEHNPIASERDQGKGPNATDRISADKQPVAKGKPTGTSLAAAQATSYTVKKGDTLWGLAEKRWGRGKAKAKVQEILALNSGTLKNDSDLRTGQVIKLP